MNANAGQGNSLDKTTPATVNVIRWGWGSIAVNVTLAALHSAIAVASGSLAVAAELTHNFLDLVSAVAVLIGLKVAMRTSRAYPYDLCKIENLIAAGIAVMAFFTAYEIARRALAGTLAPPRADTWMLVLLFCTWALPLVFSRYELRAARLANSPALIADAREYRMHAYTPALHSLLYCRRASICRSTALPLW
jgi:divalent metal cation (Fe/Co/Zn/Cd) transporter